MNFSWTTAANNFFPWHLSSAPFMALTSFHLYLSTETDVLSLYVFLEQNSNMIQLWLPKNLANLENSAVATGLEKVSFHSNPKECSNYGTTALISHTSKVVLKIL